jgi:hypothetical protein
MHRHAQGASRSWFCPTILIALLTAPAAALAAPPRIVVPHVQGVRGGALTKQLTAALCEPFDCAPRSTAYTGSRPDFAKARRNGVSAIVFGSVGGNEPNRHLWVALFTTSREPDRTWTVPLRRNGLVPRRSLEEIVREIERRLAPRAPAQTPRPAERAAPSPPVAVAPPAPMPAPAQPAPARVPAPLPALPPEPARVTSSSSSETPASPPAAPRPVAIERTPAAPPPRPAAPAQPIAAAAPAPSSPDRPRWASLELGAYVASRKLDYSGTSPAGTSPLQTMQADAIASPRVYLEVFPAAAAAFRPIAGLGAFAEYRRSVGFEVRAGSETHSAQLSQLSAGVAWHLPPVTSWRLAFTPAVSYERRDLDVSGTIPGFPEMRLRGVRAGAGMELPLGARYALLLGAGYVRWTSAGDLVRGGAPFFPSGSASAIEAEAGLSIGLFGRYSARLVGEYGATSYALDPDPTGTYRASGATDRSAGVRASVRADF